MGNLLKYFIIFVQLTLHLCTRLDMSEVLSSREKITRLMKEESERGKSLGYNVAKIKLANEVIVQLMQKGITKEQGEEILRLISEYTVGMNENTLDVVMLNNIPNMWHVYDEIYDYGKPQFIEYNCDLLRMRTHFGWDDGPVTYFKYIRNDALEAWNYFSSEMAGLLLQAVEPFQPKDLRDACKDSPCTVIYVLGKPPFIDYKFNA